MIPIGFTKILTAANTTVVATSQARGSAGSLTLSSGPPVLLDTQRRISIVLTASNSGAVLTVGGTNDSGGTIGETITIGATATTMVTQHDYKAISLISSDRTLTGNIIAGTNATGSTPWQMPSPYVTPPVIHVGVTLTASGAATFSAEYTLDVDPCGIRAPITTAANSLVSSLMSGMTTSHSALINHDGTSNLPVPVSAWRLTITAGTGGAQVNAVQAG